MPEPTSANQPAATPELSGFAKDVNGDWKTAEQRFHDATHLARTAQAQAAQFQAQLELVQSQLNSQPRPQQPAYLDAVAEQLGLSRENLAGALAEIAAPMVRSAIGPIQDSIVARQRLSTEVPDFIKNENEVFAWAATQPHLMNEVNQAMRTPGMATLATKFLFREWQAANPPSAFQAVGAPPNAGMPPLGGGGSPSQQAAQAESDADNAAFLARMQKAIRTHNPDYVASDMFKNVNWIAPPGMA